MAAIAAKSEKSTTKSEFDSEASAYFKPADTKQEEQTEPDEQLSTQTEAETEADVQKEIETEDSKRYGFHKYYTNEIWGMSNGYELCLDEGILGIDGCVKMILDYLKIRNLI